jgi:hypothetical protein
MRAHERVPLCNVRRMPAVSPTGSLLLRAPLDLHRTIMEILGAITSANERDMIEAFREI